MAMADDDGDAGGDGGGGDEDGDDDDGILVLRHDDSDGDDDDDDDDEDDDDSDDDDDEGSILRNDAIHFWDIYNGSGLSADRSGVLKSAQESRLTSLATLWLKLRICAICMCLRI